MSGDIGWSPGAVAALRALRRYADADGIVFARDIVIALGTGPLPGESVLGDAIRNPQTGVDMNRILQPNTARGNTGQSVYGIEVEAEQKAKSDQVRRVGERHVLAALTPGPLQQTGVRIDDLRRAVEMSELGPTFSKGIAGRWHGLLETSVIIEYQDVREIDWLAETGKGLVTLWVTGSILNELDQLSYRGDSERVREKARKFTRGILEGAALDRALNADGLAVRDSGAVQMRVWAPAAVAGLRDTDHLESAFALKERGVPIVVITGDTGLIARAKSSGLQTLRPADRWQLKPEPGPRERELEIRLRRAELQKPPSLKLEAALTAVANRPALDVWLINTHEGGEAKEMTVWWRQIGATDVNVYNRVGGATFGQLSAAADGRYRQTVPAVLPPESREQIAQLTFARPPTAIEYEIWAAGSQRRLGALQLVEDEYRDRS